MWVQYVEPIEVPIHSSNVCAEWPDCSLECMLEGSPASGETATAETC